MEKPPAPALPEPRDITITPAVEKVIRERGVKGYVRVYDVEFDEAGQPKVVPKLTPWWNDPIWRNTETGAIGWHPSYKPGNTFPMPASAVAAIESRKTPEVHTTAQQKFEWLVKMLRGEARRFTTPDGKVNWPASVQAELKAAAWKMGKAGDLSVEEQVDLLARNYLVFIANKQKEHDGKKTAADWNGRYVA